MSENGRSNQPSVPDLEPLACNRSIHTILATEQLFNRPARSPNYQIENQAMHRLARLMVQQPQSLLETLAQMALDLCQAGSAGVSHLETAANGDPCFRWVAMAGAYAEHLGQMIPRNLSPCGLCLDYSAPQLFRYPHRYFPHFQQATPIIVEALVLPLQTPDGFLGTIWIASHAEQRQFDREDMRMMTSLADFTAAALQMLEARQVAETSQQALQQTNAALDRRIQARTAELQTEIAERKAAQDALECVHSKVVEILESITDAFIALDQDWRCIYVNQEAERLLQTSRSQLLEQVIWNVFPDFSGSGFEVALRQAIEQRIRVNLEEFYAPLNTWFEVHVFPAANGLSIYFRNINERKQSETEIAALNQTLQHRLDELQTLFEVVPIGILMTHDSDFQQVQANPAFAQILGVADGENASWTPPAGDERPPYRIFRNGVELAPHETPLRYAALHGVTVEQVEVDILRGDGTWFNLYGYASPLFDQQGHSRGAVAAFLDITDRKRQEAALRANAERLSLALTAARMGDWSWDISSDMVTFSERAAEIFGIPAGPYMTWTQMQTLLHDDDRDRVCSEVGRSIAEHSDYDIEYRLIRPDEQLCWVAAKGRAQYDTAGQVLGMIGVVQDITDRKQAEQAIQGLNQDLQHRVAELQTLLEVVPIGIAIAEDPGCRVIRANSFFQKLFDIKPDTNLSVTATETEPVPIRRLQQGRDVPADELPLQVSAIQGIEVHNAELQIVRPDGATFDLLGSATPLFNEQGAVRGSVAVFMDISDRKRAEAEREQILEREQMAREQAEAANRIKDEFLAVLSHELRTPLNPILGWVRLLRTGTLNDQKTAFALETIERNTKLQTQLIEDLLDVSRILRGKLSLNAIPVDLKATIAAALETVRLSAEAKSIDLQLTMAEVELTHAGSRLDAESEAQPDPFNAKIHQPKLQVLGDPARLQQIVWNLLSNAIKFTPAGGRVEIRLEKVMGHHSSIMGEEPIPFSTPHSSLPTPQYAQITVSDTGKGIPPDFLPHLFEYFRQADSSITRQFGGLGLGLAIVRHLVELHGGTVQANSLGEDQGSIFTVMLPLLPASAEAIDREVAATTLITMGSPLANLQVLVVDDDADSLNLVTVILEQAGATVAAVTSASEALQLFDRLSVDVLISDIGMPQMDGYALMRQIRSQHRQPMAAIALTAHATECDQQQARAAGFHQHLAKPIDPATLVQAIASQVDRIPRTI